MREARRRFWMATLVVTSTAALAACGGSNSDSGSDNPNVGGGTPTSGRTLEVDEQAPPKGDLVFGVEAFPANNDVYSTFDTDAVAAWRAWWEYLVRPGEDGKTFEPRLAESFTKSDDDKTYEFKLREGVKFSDGTPFTAQDVLFSWNKAFTTKTSTLTHLKDRIASMTAPDPMTVKVVFKEPWPYFLGEICCHMAAILPKKLVQKQGYEEYIKRPVGTGPFIYDKVDAGSSLTVKRNPNYWQKGFPKLNSITFQAFADDSARATAVQGGRAQLVASPPPNQLESLKSNKDIAVLTFPSARVDNLAVNTKRGALKNQKIRQAIAIGINREAIVKAGLFGTGKAANTFIVGPPALTYQDTSTNYYPYDPELAKKLVAESGMTPPVKVQLNASEGTVNTVIANVVKDSLKDAGIDVTIRRADLNTTETAIGKEDYELSTTFWANYQPDPTVQPLFAIDPDYCCDAYFSGYDSKADVERLNKAIAATDPEERRQGFADVQKALAESAHLIPLFFPDLTYLSTTNLAGFFAYPNNIFAFEQWQLR
jgi:peptide/nickel transport system substrate-binding protein